MHPGVNANAKLWATISPDEELGVALARCRIRLIGFYM